MIAIFQAAAAYFGLVFAAGFILGVLRQLVLLLFMTERSAELVEIPLMVLVSYLAARFVVRRWRQRHLSGRLATGLIALALLLAAEILVVLTLRGLTIAAYLATRDPVAGAAYAVGLALFGLMPALAGSSVVPAEGRSR